VRRCQLRRGAWYPVLSLATEEAVLVVRRRGVIIPLAYLEITHTRPDRWTLLAREGYAVCPNCAERRTRRGRATTGTDALRQVSWSF